MNCPNCNTEVKVKGKTTLFYEIVNKLLDSNKYHIPFYCTVCGAIKFPYRAIRNIVFIWPLMHYIEEAKSDIIIIPDELKYSEYSNFGIVLSYGPGFYNRKKKDKWIPVTGLSVGMKVVYDKTVPWCDYVPGIDGKKHKVIICSFADVSAEVVD